MSYIGNVKVGSATHLVGSTLYGTCNTAAGTAEKAVTCANFDQLLTGVTIHVKFDNTNTIANPTLNVNNTGAKAIKRYGTTAPSTSVQSSWYAGAVISFTYDGTYWMMDDWTYTADGSDISTIRPYYTHFKAGGNGIKQYSMFSSIGNDEFSSFTTNNGTGTKTINPDLLFDLSKIYYYTGSGNVASGTLTGNNTVTYSINLVDARYTFNGVTNQAGTSSMVANKPVYMAFYGDAIDDNKYRVFTLDPIQDLDNHFNFLGILSSWGSGGETNPTITVYKDGKTGGETQTVTAKAGDYIIVGYGYIYYYDGSKWIQSGTTGLKISLCLFGYAYDSYRFDLLLNNPIKHYVFSTKSTQESGAYVYSREIIEVEEGIKDNTSHNLGTSSTSSYCGAFNHSVVEGIDCLATHRSHAEGEYTSANGICSHAEGGYTNSNNYYSHTEGYYTVSDGSYSHAEGQETSALSSFSHAEGYGTSSSGKASHAEGYITTANGGDGSHAEGYYTLANGLRTHAEGYATTSNGNASHAEGNATCSSSAASHAEGDSCKAVGKSAHAEGDYTTASGSGGAHAEGSYTYSNYTGSHAEGVGSTAVGEGSHAEGKNTFAATPSSHAEGDSSSAVGLSAHAEGKSFSAGQYSHGEGSTSALGSYSHAEGYCTTASGANSHAEGYYSRAVSSHAEGGYTISNGIYSHAEGYYTTADGGHSHAEGGQTYAKGENSHAEGEKTTAFTNYSHAEGERTTAYGEASHSEGYYTSSSQLGSHAEGQNTTACGYPSHAEGKNTYAGMNGSHAEGYYTTAKGTGYGTHAEGYYTIASGSNGQHVEGRYNVEDVNMAHIIGGGTNASNKKNIFTVSWDGDVTAGRSTGIENSNKLVTGADIYSAGLAPINYSTTEQATGKYWIDGKEIYQLTVDCGTMPAATQNKTVNLTYSDGTYIPIDMVVNYTSMATNIGGGLESVFLINNYTGVASQGAMNIYILRKDKGAGVIIHAITMYCNSDRSTYKLYFTLWYTKTS